MMRLAWPSIAAQLVNLLYSIVDRAFLGHVPGIGAEALTGLGICMPVIVFVSSFTMLAAAGGAPLASMQLGRGNAEQAQKVVLHIQTLLVFFAMVLMIVGYCLMPQLLGLFGGGEATLPYGTAYLSIYLAGTPFVMVSSGLGMVLLAQGDSLDMFAAQASGALANVVLDALFIFSCGWGITGAAIASIVSQALSAFIVGWRLRRPGSALKLEFKLVRPSWPLVGKIISIGSGRFFIIASESLLIIVANGTLQAYGGDLYVGTMTVLYATQSIIYAPAQGFTQGVQPILSYCYGAGDIARVRSAARRIVLVAFAGAACPRVWPLWRDSGRADLRHRIGCFLLHSVRGHYSTHAAKGPACVRGTGALTRSSPLARAPLARFVGRRKGRRACAALAFLRTS